MSRMLDKLDELESRLNRLLETLETERAENSRLRCELDQRSLGTEKTEELRTQLEETRTAHSVMARESETRISDLSEESALLKEQLTAEKDKYRKLVTELNAIKSERESDRKNWNDVHKRVENILKELEEIPEPDEAVDEGTDTTAEKLEDGEIEEIEFDDPPAEDVALNGQDTDGLDEDESEEMDPFPEDAKDEPKAMAVPELEPVIVESTPEDEVSEALDDELDDDIAALEPNPEPENEDGLLFGNTDDDGQNSKETVNPRYKKKKEEDDLI